MKRRNILRCMMLIITFMVFLGVSPVHGAIMRVMVCGSDSTRYSSVNQIANLFKKNKVPKYNKVLVDTFCYDSENDPVSLSSFKKELNSFYGSSGTKDLNVYIYFGHGSYPGQPISNSRAITYLSLAKMFNKYRGKTLYMSGACLARRFYTMGVAKIKNADNKFLCLSASGEDQNTHGNAYAETMIKGLTYKNRKLPADYKHKDGFVDINDLFRYIVSYDIYDSFVNPSLVMYMDGNGVSTDFPIYQNAYLTSEMEACELNIDESKQLSVTVTNPVKKIEYEVVWAKVKGIKDGGDVSLDTSATKGAATHTVSIQGIKAGPVKIRAYINHKKYGRIYGSEVNFSIQVNEEELFISPKSKTINVGQSFTIKVKNKKAFKNKTIQWASSKPGVAAVSSSGVVEGISKGKAVISATVNGEIARCSVKVKDTFDLMNYVDKDYHLLLEKIPEMIHESSDPAGSGTLYKYSQDDGIGDFFFRYNKTTDKIWLLQNGEQRKDIPLYGVKYGMKPSKAKAKLKAYGWKMSKKTTATDSYWMDFTKGVQTLRVRVSKGKVRSYQWRTQI